MAPRIQDPASQPDISKGVQDIFKAVYSGGVPQQTLELVHLRASQINGCSACTDAGATSADKPVSAPGSCSSWPPGTRTRASATPNGPPWRSPAVAGGTGVLRLSAAAGDVEFLHRHISWIVPVLELSLVSAVIAYVAGIAAAPLPNGVLAKSTSEAG